MCWPSRQLNQALDTADQVVILSGGGGQGREGGCGPADGAAGDTVAAGTGVTITGTDTKTIAVTNPYSAPVVSSILTVTTSWQNVSTGHADDDVVTINTEGAYSTETSNIAMTSVTVKFSDLSTSSRWLGIRANAQGARIEVRRNGTNIQSRSQGGTSGTKAWTVTW